MITKIQKSYIARILIIATLILGWVGIYPTQPVLAATTLTVMNTNDSGAGSLRQSITSAAAGDIIVFDASLSGKTITVASTLVIDKSLTINGSALASKISISGNNKVRVFDVSKTDITVTLDSLRIVNGLISTSEGGGLGNRGTLTVKNSIFSANTANHGGAIVNGGTLTISDSTFTGNTATGSSPNSGGNGGAILNFGPLTITNVTFTGNTTNSWGSGGAIFNDDTLSISNSTFSGNHARQGGALDNNSGRTVDITNSVVFNNSAIHGGGIVNYGVLNIANSEINSNAGGSGGGGIHNAGTLNLANSTVSDNTADEPYTVSNGGGIYNTGTMLVTGSTFWKNKASTNGDGGAIYNSSALTIINSTFLENISPAKGGAIYNSGTLDLTNSTIAGILGGTLRVSGIYNAGTLNFSNTILANSNLESDCYNATGTGIIGVNVNNLVEANAAAPNNCGTPALTADPMLAPLANNGGPTQTMALLPGSPAIDAGNATKCPATDQRGIPRPVGSKCDIGSFELVGDADAPTLLSFTRQNPTTATTSADVLVFQAAFSKAVTQVDSADFAVSGTTTATVTDVTSVTASTYDVTVSGGDLAGYNGSVGLNLSGAQNIKDLAGHALPAGEPAVDETYTINNAFLPLPAEWVGSITATSNKNVVAVGRPHIGAEVASYDGFALGSLTSYVPMLFKKAYGTYNSALYVQNVNASNQAFIEIDYYDSEGNLKCTKQDVIKPLSSRGYWLPTETCQTGSLDDGFVGGAVVTSNQPIVTAGRPHVGSEIMTYDGFTSGSLTSYIPMLFKGAYGGSYNSAFYIQNVNAYNQASITIKYYDSDGNLKCTKADKIQRLASKGYWVPTATCDTGSIPAGWIGGVVVTSDQPIVGIGRPHIGTQVTTYNGFTGGSINSYIPMLFKGAYGGLYNAAFYLQNTNDSVPATISMKYYDSNGNLNCTKTDTIQPLASKGYWVPTESCTTGTLDAGWVGGVIVTSDQPVVGVGRPHIGAQVTTYNGFTAGSPNSFLPMLFKGAYGGSYNSAFYIQNTENSQATLTLKFYDTSGNLTCTRTDTVAALSTLGYWLPTVTCTP